MNFIGVNVKNIMSRYKHGLISVLTIFGMREKKLKIKKEKITSMNEMLEILVQYYVSNYSKLGGRIYAKGCASTNGYDIDAFETTARFLPLLCSIFFNKQLLLELEQQLNINIEDVIYDIFYQGLETENNRWPTPIDRSQVLVDAHDVALSYFFLLNSSKNKIVEDVSLSRKLKEWLVACSECEYRENNWLLFKLYIDELLLYCDGRSVDYSLYEEIKSFYIAQGFFEDGVDGDIDLYSVWGFLYTLYYLSEINPEKYLSFYSEIKSEQKNFFDNIMDKNGQVPIWGRSIIYRTAWVLPYSLDYIEKGTKQSASVVGSVYRYHLDNGLLDNGRITNGFYSDNVSLQDGYSGPGASLWSLRSIIPLVYKRVDFTSIELCEFKKSWALGTKKIIVGSELSFEMIDGKTYLEIIKNKENNSYKAPFFLKIFGFLLGKKYRDSGTWFKKHGAKFDSLNDIYK